MKKTISILIILILLFGAFLAQVVISGSSPVYAFSEQEIDNLTAPIALYPDPLLAVMLPASTYPTEIANADAWLKNGGTVSDIEGQNWDESVKATAYYSDVLSMMAGNLDWVADLGDAFLNQPEDVTRSIQRLRWLAKNAGNLESNDNQQVVIDGENIEIIPAQPEVMYVPQYDNSDVYENSWEPGEPALITFGIGLAIGSWLSMDFDWHSHHVIYHGWNRRGWVNRARPHIHVPDVYINRSRASINQTWRHDVSHGDPEKFRASQPVRVNTSRFAHAPDIRGRETTPAKVPRTIFGPRGDTSLFSNRGRQSLGTINKPQTPPAAITSRQPSTPAPGFVRQPSAPIPHVIVAPSQPRPAIESAQPARTPSITFGGYRGGNEANTQSQRGQSSRQSMETRPSVPPPSAPSSRSSVPEGRSPSGGRFGR
jgi:Protein of unknown function (DUF3300)